ncbi:MAG: hypothetical protein E7531_07415 [Ruminococcaceae bacterium]|nr:hypothetical protein [Oscillospiraceae bacterium]
MKKIFCLTIVLVVIMSLFCLPTQAATPEFSWKEYDKGYVTIVFDDARDCTVTLANMFKEHNMPLSCAVPGKVVANSPSMVSILKSVQNHGGEILSHTQTHSAFHKDSTLAEIEDEFSKSYDSLTKAGFVVNGIIEAGSGGAEKQVDYNLVEQVVSKYYKYSDCYGTSLQYKSVRTWMHGQSLAQLKAKVSRAANRKEWLILFAHDFGEISQSDLEALLQHIKDTEDMQCVTYKYMYENFGNYSKPQNFGDTFYTVSYADKDGKVFEEKVVKSGSIVSGSPDNAPEGTEWSEIAYTVTDNITISPIIDQNEAIDTPSNPDGNASNNDDDAHNPKDPIQLWIVIAIGIVVLLIIVLIIIFAKKKKK